MENCKPCAKVDQVMAAAVYSSDEVDAFRIKKDKFPMQVRRDSKAE